MHRKTEKQEAVRGSKTLEHALSPPSKKVRQDPAFTHRTSECGKKIGPRVTLFHVW